MCKNKEKNTDASYVYFMDSLPICYNTCSANKRSIANSPCDLGLPVLVIVWSHGFGIILFPGDCKILLNIFSDQLFPVVLFICLFGI